MHKKLIVHVGQFRAYLPPLRKLTFNFLAEVTLKAIGVIEFPEMHQHFNRM